MVARSWEEATKDIPFPWWIWVPATLLLVLILVGDPTIPGPLPEVP